MASHPSRRTIDVLRELCQEEVQAAIDPIRHEIIFLRLRWQTAISDLREEISDLKQQVQACGLQSQTESLNGTSRLGHRVREVLEPQDEPFILENAEEHERLFCREISPAVESSEYEDILERASVELDLGQDCWGAATMVIVKDFGDIAAGQVGCYQFLRSGVVLWVWFLNIFLSVGLLVWIYHLVVLPDIGRLQHRYQKFHREAFVAGKFDLEALYSLDEDRGEICTSALSHDVFTMACVFLWASVCAHEIASAVRRKRHLDRLPPLPPRVPTTNMCHEIKVWMGRHFQNEKLKIVCLDRCMRAWLNLLVFVPRTIVALCLLLMGTAFLTTSDSHTDLLLNSLAMTFIFDIDAILFTVFMPAIFVKRIQGTYIVSPSEEILHHKLGKELRDHKIQRGYAGSALAFISVTIFVCCWFGLMPVLPGYEWDLSPGCRDYLISRQHISCKPWDHDCFSKGM